MLEHCLKQYNIFKKGGIKGKLIDTYFTYYLLQDKVLIPSPSPELRDRKIHGRVESFAPCAEGNRCVAQVCGLTNQPGQLCASSPEEPTLC